MDTQTNYKELPLLSVCIRAHNIEKELLDRCISSVVHQTYTNIEIILVNNFSNDDTGLYCDEWLQKDHRIQVIHSPKENISFHTMLGYTTGEYVHLLDHDDWIDPNMYAKMMSAMLSTNSDIARCEFCFAYPDGRIVQRNITHNTDYYEVIGRDEGVLLILENKKWQTYRWQNIFKKNLLDFDIPNAKTYADLAGTHVLFHHALQTVYLHDVFYFYYQRPGSIVNPQSRKGKKKNSYHRSNALYERYLFVKQHPQYHSMLRSAKKKSVKQGIYTLWDMIDYPQYFREHAYETQAERLKQFSLSPRDGILFIFNLDLWILKKLPRCYKLFYKIIYFNLIRLYRCIIACCKLFTHQEIVS